MRFRTVGWGVQCAVTACGRVRTKPRALVILSATGIGEWERI